MVWKAGDHPHITPAVSRRLDTTSLRTIPIALEHPEQPSPSATPQGGENPASVNNAQQPQQPFDDPSTPEARYGPLRAG